MLSEPEESEQGSASVRLLEVDRRQHGANCGFHLTRSKWDPYPWVSAVDAGSAADFAGVRPGDCVLEVNGEDVLGRRVGEIAEVVRARPDQLSLLLWNSGVDLHCTPENLCCGPMPSNMQRLSTCLSAILCAMECPVCMDTIAPPASQCVNGHIICSRCHARSERCPVCRIRLSRGRSLFADQVYNSVVDAFELFKEKDDKMRTAKINEIFRLRKNSKQPEIKITPSHTNRFLERAVEKASSAENLSNQILMPKSYLSEFNSNLRTKSLSTSEIFNAGTCSPGGSPRALFKEGNKMNLISRMQCGRSFENLNEDRNTYDNHNDCTSQTYEFLCYCPFSSDCIEQIKGDMITQHFQVAHDGPYIQYFKHNITFDNIRNFHNNTYCIQHKSGKQFFLKINAIDEDTQNRTEEFPDLLIWMWCLGTSNVANEYQLQIKLYNSPTKVLFSVTSTIYSLCTVSWIDIKSMQKGIFLSNETLKALNSHSSDIILDVEIKHCER